MRQEKDEGGAGAALQGRASPPGAAAAILPFVLGFTAPFLVAVGSRLLLEHADKVARDVVPLLVILVFACFTALALRRLPQRRWFVVAVLYAGATLGTAVEVLLDPAPGRRLVVEIFVIWWLAAPAVFAGILLEQLWRRKRRGA
jgi:hypothetical protein